MKRSEGERVRALHQISLLEGLIGGLRQTLERNVPCLETAQAVADVALRVATTCARRDAYAFAEAWGGEES